MACGMAFTNRQDIREGDRIACFQVEPIERKPAQIPVGEMAAPPRYEVTPVVPSWRRRASYRCTAANTSSAAFCITGSSRFRSVRTRP